MGVVKIRAEKVIQKGDRITISCGSAGGESHSIDTTQKTHFSLDITIGRSACTYKGSKTAHLRRGNVHRLAASKNKVFQEIAQ